MLLVAGVVVAVRPAIDQPAQHVAVKLYVRQKRRVVLRGPIPYRPPLVEKVLGKGTHPRKTLANGVPEPLPERGFTIKGGARRTIAMKIQGR